MCVCWGGPLTFLLSPSHLPTPPFYGCRKIAGSPLFCRKFAGTHYCRNFDWIGTLCRNFDVLPFNLLTTERILWYINVVKPLHFTNCVLDIVSFRKLKLKLDNKGESLIYMLLSGSTRLNLTCTKHIRVVY